MQIKKGDDRVVVVFPELGFVLKFPVIRLWIVFRQTILFIWNRDFTSIQKHWMYPMRAWGGFRGLLFKGLAANWSEFWFYWQTRNRFLQPTYFSFFGLLNIQRFGTPCSLKGADLWCQLHEMTNRKVWDDSHHFAEPSNFCLIDGKLRMLDYGSPASRGVVTLYGEKIFELFDPSYSWEEEKKKLIAKRGESAN